MRLIVDAGPLYAYSDRRDPNYAACLDLLRSETVIVPMLAIAEAAYLVRSRLGASAEPRWLADFVAGHFIAEPVHPADWVRITELVARYRDLPLGTVDASIVATAERLGITRIATLDRRDFTIVRPAHAEAFELVPPVG